jgi:hypothetical protein
MIDDDIPQKELERAMEIDDRLEKEVFPIVDAIDQDYEEAGVFYALFLNVIHTLFDEGWTADELIESVQEHADLHMQEQINVSGGIH